MEALPSDLAPALRRRAEVGAAWVREQKANGRKITVVCHIDADGVTSGAIAAEALTRAGVPHVVQPVKSLDELHVKLLEDGKPEALWFCDLGSTMYMHFDLPRLVCDHHQLVRDGTEESFAHVNPLLDGLSGEEISGAGCAYLVAAAFDAANIDLLPLALVGASADLQDRRNGRFTGANAALLRLGIALGLLEERRDIAWFGTETRPLRKFLAFAEPAVPTATGDGRSAEALCLALGIELQDALGERSWTRLTADEQRRLRGAFVERLIAAGLSDRIPKLWRQVVTIAMEAPGRPTRELQEFGTLLNSTARYGRPEVGLAVARGDRDLFYTQALDLLLDHRKHLVGALNALAATGITDLAAIQWAHLQDRVLDTVVGIVCGMALEGLALRRDRVLVGLAWTPDGRTKVSGRAPHEMVPRGIDLSIAMREAAAAVGGQGGGHPGAAGATIPREAEGKFIAELDQILARQVLARTVLA